MEHNIYLALLAESFDAKMDQLIEELRSYTNEELIWKTPGQISNSSGTLAVHLLGNLNHFIGALLGNTGYERNRPLEFSINVKTRDAIIADLISTRTMINKVLRSVQPDKLGPYPAEFSGTEDPDVKSLIHIYGHLAYHTGQINYHRRLLDI